MLGAGVDALEHAQRAAPDSGGSCSVRRAARRRAGAEQRVVAVAPVGRLEEGLVRAYAPDEPCGRRRVELEHAQLLVAVRVHVVPGVAAEERAAAARHAQDLAGLGVRDTPSSRAARRTARRRRRSCGTPASAGTRRRAPARRRARARARSRRRSSRRPRRPPGRPRCGASRSRTGSPPGRRTSGGARACTASRAQLRLTARARPSPTGTVVDTRLASPPSRSCMRADAVNVVIQAGLQDAAAANGVVGDDDAAGSQALQRDARVLRVAGLSASMKATS